MNTAFERDFSRVLEAEVGDVGEPDPELYRTVHGRVRHRRRRRGLIAAGVAVCAVAAASGTVVAAIQRGGDNPPTTNDPAASASATPTPPPDPNRVPDWVSLPAVREVWPNAVRSLPGRLPDGAYYLVEAMLPGNRYLVLTWSDNPPGFKLSRPAIFDPAADTLTVLAEMNGPHDFVIGVGVVGDRAVWVNHVLRANLTTVEEVWSAPLAGGPAQKIATVEGQGSFTIAGDYVMWDRWGTPDRNNQATSPGIYRLPATGGQPQLIPDTRNFILSRQYSGFGGAAAVAARGSLTGGELIDLITGRRFSWTLSPDAPTDAASTNYVHCGTVGCTGRWGTPSTGDRAIVQRLDGSGYLDLGYGDVGPAGEGRFVLYRFRHDPANSDPSTPTGDGRLAIWDRTTGRAALCYSIPIGANTGSVPGREAFTRPFVTWAENGNVMLLDLSALR
jgi:hypothetical protein